MTEQKTNQNSRSLSRELIRAAGEVVVRNSQRRVQIENIITREGGLPTLFVARYLDSTASDQYLFYKEELAFPKSAKLEALAG